MQAGGAVMSSRDDGTGEDKPGPARSGRRRKRSDASYDRWLTDRLHEVYDPVLREPVPPELERMLGAFAPRPKAGSDKP